MPAHPSLVVSLALWCACSALFSAAPTALAFVAPPSPSRLSPPSTCAAAGDPPDVSVSDSLSHSDIEWRLRPPEGTSRVDRWKIKLGATLLRLESKWKGEALPPVLCPRGGRALLEAYHKEPGQRKKKKIARFGLTTTRGPSSPEIDATIRETYGIDPPPLSAAIAAIVYMFVEPDHRGRDVGARALEVVSAIQAVQAVDFTVLVADDDGSGGLVRWYERHGYSRAPRLQDALGSPEGAHGVAMIAPVAAEAEFFDRCAVKWW